MLANNDHIVISRSKEAKALGIKMGRCTLRISTSLNIIMFRCLVQIIRFIKKVVIN
ncbi:hypothetical protein C9446_20010 (plasmid) [Providencia heimbachae]|uniref:hypothetical protein n=1 Tax=Providencia heimbachae TaxID=333962 RepID=UPI0010BE6750|nr:hypothetical protein C9446_20010 [Providencia heimbachae]